MFLQTNAVFTKEIDRINMNVSEAVYVKLDKGWSHRSIRPAFSRVYGILEGEGLLHCGNRQIPMVPGNVYILPAGLDFSYTCLTPMNKVYFHVNLLRYDNYDLFYGFNDCLILPNHMEDIEKTASWLHSTSNQDALRLKAWLYQVVAEMVTEANIHLGDVAEYSNEVKGAIRYINQNLHSGLNVQEVAEAVNVPSVQLQKIFCTEIKVPLKRYINDRLMFIAEQKLRLSDSSISQISDDMGFCDSFYFSRMFKGRYGVSPTGYRKRLALESGERKK